MSYLKTVLLPVVFIFCAACAPVIKQVPIPPGTPLESTFVIEIPGENKDELFGRSKQFFVEAFISAPAVIQYENKNSGRIVGKGIVTTVLTYGQSSMPWNFNCTFTVDIKDGKARLVTNNYSHSPLGQQLQYMDALEHLQPELDAIGELFKARLQKPLVSNENW